MRSFDEWNAGRFLRAGDYDPGDSFAVTVVKVAEEVIQRDHGPEPALILTLAREDGHWGDYLPNLTARRALARLFGRDPMAMVGQGFTLVVVITGFEGRNGFQVQPAARQSPKAPPPPPSKPQAPITATAANTRPRPGRPPGQGKGASSAASAKAGGDVVDELNDEVPY
jgi:hypothetical protein